MIVSMRQPRGNWESEQTEDLLQQFAAEQFHAGIIGLYVVKLGERQSRYKTIIDRPLDESNTQQACQTAIAAARLEQLLRARPAEVYLAPYHKTRDGYSMIVLGKVLPQTGLYIPESTVPLMLDRYSSSEHLPTEEQARILLDQCVELADHDLVPGNEYDELE